MNHNVSIQINNTSQPSTGNDPVNVIVTLNSENVTVPISADPTQMMANFIVPDGDYTASAQNIDANGNPVGAAFTADVSALAPAPDVLVGTGMTVTVTPAP